MKKTYRLIVLAILLLTACKKQELNPNASQPSGNNGNPPAPAVASITSFYPKATRVGDTIGISGKNLPIDLDSLMVSFGSVPAVLLMSFGNQLIVKVPPGFDSAVISVTIKDKTLSFQDKFYVADGYWYEDPYNPNVPNLSYAKSFTIGNKIYILGGYQDEVDPKTGVLIYDIASGLWKQEAAPFPNRQQAVAFAIGNKGYFGLGDVNGLVGFNDFWEFDPATDGWTKKTGFPGGNRSGAVGFAIGNTGYVGMGSGLGDISQSDFWSFDPGTDQWTKLSDFPGLAVNYATGFSSASRGYVVFGMNTGNNEFSHLGWEFDPATQSWKNFASFPGYERTNGVGFLIGNKIYAGLGENQKQAQQDFWEYDMTQNNWIRKASLSELRSNLIFRGGAVAAGFNGQAFVGFGHDPYGEPLNDWWQFAP